MIVWSRIRKCRCLLARRFGWSGCHGVVQCLNNILKGKPMRFRCRISPIHCVTQSEQHLEQPCLMVTTVRVLPMHSCNVLHLRKCDRKRKSLERHREDTVSLIFICRIGILEYRIFLILVLWMNDDHGKTTKRCFKVKGTVVLCFRFLGLVKRNQATQILQV